jgi:hypothetical protein
VLLDMGAFCRSSGPNDQELPYTTSRALDVKQPDTSQHAPSSTWWQRLTGRPCGPDRSSSELKASGDLSTSFPRHLLPSNAQMSQPFLASQVGSNSGSLAVSLGGPSAGNAASSSRSRSTAQLFGDLQEVPDVAPKQDVAVVGRLEAFSAQAWKQLAELRKSITRSSQSTQGTHATRRDWESVRLFQVGALNPKPYMHPEPQPSNLGDFDRPIGCSLQLKHCIARELPCLCTNTVLRAQPNGAWSRPT